MAPWLPPSGATGAMLWQSLGGQSGSEVALSQALGADARCVGTFNGTLYASALAVSGFNGVSALGALAAVATNQSAQTTVLHGTTLVAGAAASPWAFVLESAASLWVADDGAPSAYNLVHYVMSGAAASLAWAATKTVLLTSGTGVPLPVVYSITVRGHVGYPRECRV